MAHFLNFSSSFILTFFDRSFPKILQNFKFIHVRVDETVGGPLSTRLGIKYGLQTPWYKNDSDRRNTQVSLFYSNKVFHQSWYIVIGNQNPDMNIIYLKTKELLCQADMTRERGSNLSQQLKRTGPQTQFSQFSLVLWFGGMFSRLERY